MEKEILSTFEAARYCQVHPGTIKNWIRNENLKAFKTPGGHRRIYRKDLDKFLKEKNIPISYETRNQRRKVLIIDSDYGAREQLSKHLMRWTGLFETASASNSFEAGELLVVFKPDLIILESSLPGVDITDVCRHIKASLYLEDPKIIIKANGDKPGPEIREADGFIPTGVDGEKLRNEIEKALGAKSLK